jgi:NAD(P)-dependent dehydrogenase (short-subunit alcohol dehydrogenase family)
MRFADLKDKVVIITGGTSGIGLALVKEFASYGTKTVVASIDKDALAPLEEKLLGDGRDVLTVYADVSKEDDCRKIIDLTLERFGQIDILVNNAGISMRALFKDLKLDVITKLMEVNFWGMVYCTYHALPYLIESRGTVAGISSIAGYKGLPGRTGYSASKFAMVGFLESLRIEHSRDGLHVLIAAPWFTRSNIRNAALGPDGLPQGISPRKEKNMVSPEWVARRIVRGVVRRRKKLILTLKGKVFLSFNAIFPCSVDRLTYNELSREPGSPLKNK